jgi:hypothetical protein
LSALSVSIILCQSFVSTVCIYHPLSALSVSIIFCQSYLTTDPYTDNLLYLYTDFPKSQHPCIHELSHNQSADAVVELVALSAASFAVVFASGVVEGISFEASGLASNAVLRDERAGKMV